MKKIFKNIGYLDKRLVEEFAFSEDIMQENAASSLNKWVRKNLKKGKKVQILCGPGNNGADGLACARMLKKDYCVSVLLPLGVRSNMAKLQLERLKKLNIKIDKKLKKAALHVDAIFGSGLNKALPEDIKDILIKVNQQKSFKLSCDVPTGIMEDGNILDLAFRADATISMGALKTSLFSDLAKDYVGKIKVANLGVSRKVYEKKTNTFLLEKKDLSLPERNKQNANKGDFGHLVVIGGKKKGASILSAKAGFVFGAGLVSVLGKKLKLPNHLMICKKLPQNTTAIAAGMGLGKLTNKLLNLLTNTSLPMVLDADILRYENLKQILDANPNLVLTPHPKEFSQMCKNLGFGDFSVRQIQENRFEIAREFSLKFPQILVLKGANTLIAKNGIIYVCPHGNQALARGGSGDVLSGLIGSLLAQGYSPIYSAINGVLAHALSLKNFKYRSYALDPKDVIKGIKCL